MTHSVITLSSGATFSAPSGVSILEAAIRANIAMPYSCKMGRCSTCMCRVKSGLTTAIHEETGLSEQEKGEGWVLSCARAAATDLELETDDLGGVTLPGARTWPCRIDQIKRLAPDIVQVFLRLPPTAVFNFIPGQYIDIIGPNGVRRSYSMANAGFGKGQLEFHIRAVPNGEMSRYWFYDAREGDLLRLNGPQGTFFLRKTANVDLIFLATGTGIAPVKAMLESLPDLRQGLRPKSVVVLWGGRRQEDFYFDLSGIPGDRNYIPVLSRKDSGWKGASGYVQEVLLGSTKDLTNAAVYACGSNEMIRSAKSLLLDAGLMHNSFFSDAFVCSASEKL